MKNIFGKIPWQIKLLIIMLFLAVLPSFLISYNIIGIIRDELKSNINGQLISSSKEISRGISSKVTRYYEALNLFKGIAENQNLAADQKISLLVSGIKKMDNMLALSIFALNNKEYEEAFTTEKDFVVRKGKKIEIIGNYDKREWIEGYVKGSIHKWITPPVFNKKLQLWTCMITLDANLPGIGEGIISVLVDLSDIADDIESHLSINRLGVLFVTDETGRKFLTSKIITEIPDQIQSDAANLLKLNNLSLINSYSGEKGDSYVASFNKLENTGWVAVSVMSEGSAYAVVNSALFYFLIYLFVSVGVSSGAAILFSRHLSKPIINMAFLSNNIADGRYDIDVTYKAKDSIGILNLSLFKMGKQLKKNFKEIEEQKLQLEDYSRNLEKKVEERTNELSESNRELKIAYQRVLELNEEKNEFLGIAAHDLKNPLVAISGFAEIMKENKDATIESNEAFLDEIVKASNRMFSIVKNLLDVNAIEQGKLNTKMEKVDLKEIISEILGQFREAAEKKSIKIFDSYFSEGCFVIADNNITMQIIQNILSNAIKFSPVKKIIFLSVVMPEEGGMIEIRIKDQGPGFSDEDKKKLFQKFARLSARPTGGEHSTGLGLSIVKKLVEMMEGTIRLESEYGKGAEFIIALKIYKEEEVE